MGLTFTKLFNKLFSKKEMRILMVRAGGVFRALSGRQTAKIWNPFTRA